MSLQELMWEPEPEWREDAACLGVDIEIFFPAGEELDKIAAAKEVCAGCSVKEECLRYAFATNQTEGVWGGHTSSERRRIRRRLLKQLRRAS